MANLKFIVQCNTSVDAITKNVKKSMKYPRLKFKTDKVLQYPPVAVVGGGPSARQSLDVLRQWGGDIYAVNDTAGFLSDNGIECYVYSVDCSRYPYKTGTLVKGALFASRVHRKQFVYDDIRVFDMAEDSPWGVGGGPTAVCRAALLFLRMGHAQVHYFGCDGSISDLETHVSGIQKVAYENMCIVRSNGIDYLSNSSWVVQSEYLSNTIRKHPRFLVNRSGGLLKAMIDNPDSWVIIAVTEDLKRQVERKGANIFPKEYNVKEHELWQAQMT